MTIEYVVTELNRVSDTETRTSSTEYGGRLAKKRVQSMCRLSKGVRNDAMA